jgi:hypothetical protein
MPRLVTSALAVSVAVLALAGCSGGSAPAPVRSDPGSAEATPTPTPAADAAGSAGSPYRPVDFALTEAQLQQAAARCAPALPAGASAAARDYARILDTSYRDDILLSLSLQASGRVSDPGQRTEMLRLDQMKATAIEADGLLAASAAPFLDALRRYDALLGRSIDASSWTTNSDAVHAADDRRTQAAGALRTKLGLPPSNCDVLRP